MENRTAKEIIIKLIDNGLLTGSEVMTLLDAINDKKIEYIPVTYPGVNEPTKHTDPFSTFPWTTICSSGLNQVCNDNENISMYDYGDYVCDITRETTSILKNV